MNLRIVMPLLTTAVLLGAGIGQAADQVEPAANPLGDPALRGLRRRPRLRPASARSTRSLPRW